TSVIRIATPHALRTGDMLFDDTDTSNLGYHIRQLIDRDQAILAQIERLIIVRLHQLVETSHAVIDITKRARLISVAPNLYLGIATELGYGHLPTEGSWRFLAPSLPRPQRTKDVMKTYNPGLNLIFLAVVQAQPLCDKFLPAIGVLRLRRISVSFTNRAAIGLLLLI